MTEQITITEVGLRDGLQNQPSPVSTDDKLKIADALLAAGVDHLEATSFAHPKWVPQMADAEEIITRLPKGEGRLYSALTMNHRGYDRAVAVDTRSVGVVITATDTFNRKNINMSFDEALVECIEIIERARNDGRHVRGYIGAAFVCPYEGQVSPDIVMGIAEKFAEAGVDELGVADTIGAANPSQVKAMMTSMVKNFGADRVGLHLHDTQGLAVANSWAALEAGIRRFDSSIGGLGGCPFAPGAKGNVATEDLVHLFEGCGFDTGIDLERLREAVKVTETATGLTLGGKIISWMDSRQQ
jgi:hydroxymethylglutaryl-CoA lyase